MLGPPMHHRARKCVEIAIDCLGHAGGRLQNYDTVATPRGRMLKRKRSSEPETSAGEDDEQTPTESSDEDEGVEDT